jgi:hypothetical protein
VTEGVMAGKDMLSFVPLHLSVLEWQLHLELWVRSWVPAGLMTILTCKDWFDKEHGVSGGIANAQGQWILVEMPPAWLLWTPPPALAEVALEELGALQHKWKHINHVIIAPRLMTYAWRK